jgi:hypothetical protein
MRWKAALLLLGASLWLPAETKLTIEQLVGFVRSSIQVKQPDKAVAEYLATVSLSERLDDRTIDDLRAGGAGPKTVEALKALGTASRTLAAPAQPTPTPPPPPPLDPPGAEEQGKVIGQARDYAMNYTKSLPDFLCTQVTRRYVDPHGTQFWGLEDTLTAHVSYVDHKEDYKLMTRNGQTAKSSSIWSVGGANSAGEFGSMMAAIFDPKTEASFHWERWATLRGRRAYVYAYQVAQERSGWHVSSGKDAASPAAETVPGYHGLIFVDRDLLAVVRVTLVAELPTDFPIQQVEDTLDYDLAAISGHEYLLPLRAVVQMREGSHHSKNEVEFRLYRKFTTEATITFDSSDAPPEDKNKK